MRKRRERGGGRGSERREGERERMEGEEGGRGEGRRGRAQAVVPWGQVGDVRLQRRE